MKPILILQNLSADGPGYFAHWLRARGVPFELRDAEAGEPWPDHLREHSALALLGGEMSANDPLPSLRRAEELIREAVAAGQPVIGHCLGGQLMARALGARVYDSPVPEIGWQPLQVLDSELARDWFGRSGPATVFQWHYEAFDLPAGAQRLAGSDACPQQAYAIGPHLGMQFHIEIDAAKVDRWSAEAGERWWQALHAHPATVQDGAGMRAALPAALPAHQALADRLYARWLAGVR